MAEGLPGQAGRELIQPDKGIIMDAETLEYKLFQFNPIPIDEDISTDFKEIKAAGISHPFYQYASGNSDQIKFELYLNDLWFQRTKPNYTEDFIRFLYRFRPERGATRFDPPPPIIIAYGPFYRNGLVSGMQISRTRLDPSTLAAIEATVTLSIITLPAPDLSNTARNKIKNEVYATNTTLGEWY